MSQEKQAKKGFLSGELVWWKEWLIFFGGGGAVFGICLSLDSQSVWELLKGGFFGAAGFLALAFFLVIIEGWRVKGWRKDRRRNCEEGENGESNSRN